MPVMIFATVYKIVGYFYDKHEDKKRTEICT